MKKIWKFLGITALAAVLVPYKVEKDEATGDKTYDALLWHATAKGRTSEEEGRKVDITFGLKRSEHPDWEDCSCEDCEEDWDELDTELDELDAELDDLDAELDDLDREPDAPDAVPKADEEEDGLSIDITVTVEKDEPAPKTEE